MTDIEILTEIETYIKSYGMVFDTTNVKIIYDPSMDFMSYLYFKIVYNNSNVKEHNYSLVVDSYTGEVEYEFMGTKLALMYLMADITRAAQVDKLMSNTIIMEL